VVEFGLKVGRTGGPFWVKEEAGGDAGQGHCSLVQGLGGGMGG
jgi:hypothetical protein